VPYSITKFIRFGVRCLPLAVLLLSPALWATDDYRLGSGDLIAVRVLGEEDFTGSFRVGSDGHIDYPYLRKIKAEGETTSSLAQRITKKLQAGYLMRPQVIVEVAEYRSKKVLVLGAVRKPGMYILKENTRVLDVISMSGGITNEGGKRIFLLRDVTDLSAEEPIPSPPAAEPLPSKEKKTSDVKVPLEAPTTPALATVLSQAKSKPVVIDYYRLVHDGDLSQNFRLTGGDVLNIPKANEIFVFGSVEKPGSVKYEDNMTIVQAVSLAGGTKPEASEKSTYILRQGKTGEEKLEVRLDKILKNETENVAVKPNDVIVIPESFF